MPTVVVPELLVAAAIGAQLIEQALSLSKFCYETISDLINAQEEVKKKLIPVNQLISLSNLIISNPALQTDSIASCLASALSELRRLDNKLRSFSASSDSKWTEKTKKAFMAVFNRKAVKKSFDTIERHKTLLVIAMHEIDS